uniref:Uncharacterized protein n=1 Tax=Opuntia streptacantha TaxID=393608 RepID=A0A7C8YJS1_OPUST
MLREQQFSQQSVHQYRLLSKTQGSRSKSSRPFICTTPALISSSLFRAASALLADASASLWCFQVRNWAGVMGVVVGLRLDGLSTASCSCTSSSAPISPASLSLSRFRFLLMQ